MGTGQNNRTTVYLFRIIAALLIAILITTQLLSGMYARFSTTAGSSAQARVAAFVFDVSDGSGTFTLDLSDISVPGESQEFEFVIKNYSAERTSEVKQSYEVTFAELGSLPLKYTCRENSGESVVINAGVQEGTHSFTGAFEAAEQASYTYNLKVEWPETARDAKYSSGSGVAALEICILSEQID